LLRVVTIVKRVPTSVARRHASSAGENLAADLTLTSDELMAIRERLVEV
jgi:hypothetical protein